MAQNHESLCVMGLAGLGDTNAMRNWITRVGIRAAAQGLAPHVPVAKALNLNHNDARDITRLVQLAPDPQPADVASQAGQAKVNAAAKVMQATARFHTRIANSLENEIRSLLAQEERTSNAQQKHALRQQIVHLAQQLLSNRVNAARTTVAAGALLAANKFAKQANRASSKGNTGIVGPRLSQAAAAVKVAQDAVKTPMVYNVPTFMLHMGHAGGIVPPMHGGVVPSAIPGVPPPMPAWPPGYQGQQPPVNLPIGSNVPNLPRYEPTAPMAPTLRATSFGGLGAIHPAFIDKVNEFLSKAKAAVPGKALIGASIRDAARLAAQHTAPSWNPFGHMGTRRQYVPHGGPSRRPAPPHKGTLRPRNTGIAPPRRVVDVAMARPHGLGDSLTLPDTQGLPPGYSLPQDIGIQAAIEQASTIAPSADAQQVADEIAAQTVAATPPSVPPPTAAPSAATPSWVVPAMMAATGFMVGSAIFK